ncbi:MAG: GIY-YIG nuclease family protein [Candidatus Blackburnbacteria bacterium]|nr:GIY-YIG nuclease family protein [Candidatus Blackburnbacteria bacterium]
MYYVYVLQSLKDNDFYTGFARDLKERVRRHHNGLVVATEHRRPLKLIYYEACLGKNDATHREIYLKTAWGKRFIKNRLKNYLKGATVK